MGVVVSSQSATSPFFLTSGIIGFISFAFTLGTFFRVVWVNLETLGEAPHEVHTYLTNLRQELLEEKASLKILKKFAKHRRKGRIGDKGHETPALDEYLSIELDEVTIRTMSDSVRHLIRRFKEVEKPFLEPGEEGISDSMNHRRSRKRGQSGSPYYEHSAYGSPLEKGGFDRRRSNHDRDRDKEDDDDAYWAQRVSYCKFTLGKRFQWLTRKSEAQQLFETLSRVQTRRIARQVGGIAVMMHENGNALFEAEDKIARIDERMSRFVGVRRVE